MKPLKIELLRTKLTAYQLDGFLIPQTDCYQNEDLSLHDQRLAWLTGYTGSSGLGIVLRERAAIFVDGRYILQVKNEVDTSFYEIYHIHETPPIEWLCKHLSKGSRIGYDAWLHTEQDIKTLSSRLKKVEFILYPCEPNLIDDIWSDQPSRTYTPPFPHPLRFTGLESKEKCAIVLQTLKEQDTDCVVLSMPDSIAWLLNIRGNDLLHVPVCLSFAVLTVTGTVTWFVESSQMTPEIVAHLGSHVTLESSKNFASHLDQIGRKGLRVLVDSEVTPSWICERLRRSGAHLYAALDPCALPKARKNSVELEGMRAAHLRDGLAVTRFLHWLTKEADPNTVTETSAAERLFTFRQEGQYFQGNSFKTISAAGPHSAIIHYHVTVSSKTLLYNETLYLCDSGAQYLDGTTDVTRTIALNTPSQQQQEYFTRVLKGHISLATTRFPHNTTGQHLDTLARKPLWDIGLDYDHGTGHGIGSYLNVHERPIRITKNDSTNPLQEGMILSNEPGYYKPGEYGIRIENLIVVIPNQNGLSFETLTLVPIDKHLILPSLLNRTEISWLNTYHHRVYTALAPYLTPPLTRWLAQITQPL